MSVSGVAIIDEAISHDGEALILLNDPCSEKYSSSGTVAIFRM